MICSATQFSSALDAVGRMLIGLKIHMESGSADSKIGVTIADSQAFGNGPRDVEKLMIEVIGLASAMYRGLRAQMFPSQTHLMLFKGLRDLMIFMTQKCFIIVAGCTLPWLTEKPWVVSATESTNK